MQAKKGLCAPLGNERSTHTPEKIVFFRARPRSFLNLHNIRTSHELEGRPQFFSFILTFVRIIRTMSSSKFTSVSKWSPTVLPEERHPPPPEVSKYSVDQTWMVPMEFQASNKTNFLIKAGNKIYTLEGGSKNGATSELGLRKKYA
jgi:hypothetical protein